MDLPVPGVPSIITCLRWFAAFFTTSTACSWPITCSINCLGTSMSLVEAISNPPRRSWFLDPSSIFSICNQLILISYLLFIITLSQFNLFNRIKIHSYFALFSTQSKRFDHYKTLLFINSLDDFMNASIQIGKIMGIPIKLHITFLLILPFFAWFFANTAGIFGFSDV